MECLHFDPGAVSTFGWVAVKVKGCDGFAFKHRFQEMFPPWTKENTINNAMLQFGFVPCGCSWDAAWKGEGVFHRARQVCFPPTRM
eukprot:3019770-Rhodomonas_salina.1